MLTLICTPNVAVFFFSSQSAFLKTKVILPASPLSVLFLFFFFYYNLAYSPKSPETDLFRVINNIFIASLTVITPSLMVASILRTRMRGHILEVGTSRGQGRGFEKSLWGEWEKELEWRLLGEWLGTVQAGNHFLLSLLFELWDFSLSVFINAGIWDRSEGLI